MDADSDRIVINGRRMVLRMTITARLRTRKRTRLWMKRVRSGESTRLM
jgi:hypothetical protein